MAQKLLLIFSIYIRTLIQESGEAGWFLLRASGRAILRSTTLSVGTTVMAFFRIDTRKAIEATATLLRLAPHREMGRKRLLALLYIADRESIKRTGRPIVGGKLVAMDYGPIHSDVYDLIKGSTSESAEWSRHFQNESYLVKLSHDLGISALSRSEVSLLNEISEARFGRDDWDIAGETHDFKEYKQNHHPNTSTPIPIEDLIEAVGRRKTKEAILRDAEEKAYFEKLFSPKK